MTRTALTYLLLLILNFSCAGPAHPPPAPSHFGPDDYLVCRSGGGEGRDDYLEIRGDGRLVYRPMGNTRIRSSRLSASQLDQLLERLIKAGLLDLTETPNRTIENYGVVLEGRLGELRIRASIGALQLQKDKHQNWQRVLDELLGVLDLESSS